MALFTPVGFRVPHEIHEEQVLPGFVLDWPGLDLRQIDSALGEGLKHLEQHPRLVFDREYQRSFVVTAGLSSILPMTKKRVMLLLRSSILLATATRS